MANRKDIVLTVSGIVAGLILTYLLWRVSQKDAAANAAALAAAQQTADANATAQQENESQFLSQYSSQASYGGGSYASTPSIDSSGDAPTYEETNDSTGSGNDLISQIIAAYATPSSTNVDSVQSQLLATPPNVLGDNTAVNNVPTSLSQIDAANSTSSAGNIVTAPVSSVGPSSIIPVTLNPGTGTPVSTGASSIIPVTLDPSTGTPVSTGSNPIAIGGPSINAGPTPVSVKAPFGGSFLDTSNQVGVN